MDFAECPWTTCLYGLSRSAPFPCTALVKSRVLIVKSALTCLFLQSNKRRNKTKYSSVLSFRLYGLMFVTLKFVYVYAT